MELPIKQFYAYQKAGKPKKTISSSCKVCLINMISANRKLKAEHFAEYRKEYWKRPKALENQRRYQNSPKGKRVKREWYRFLRTDPIRYEQYKAKRHEYYLRQKAKRQSNSVYKDTSTDLQAVQKMAAA